MTALPVRPWSIWPGCLILYHTLPLLRTSWHSGHPPVSQTSTRSLPGTVLSTDTRIISFNPRNSLTRWALLLSMLSSRRNWGPDRLTNWPKTTQWVKCRGWDSHSGALVLQSRHFGFTLRSIPKVWPRVALTVTPNKRLLNEARWMMMRQHKLVTQVQEKASVMSKPSLVHKRHCKS